MYGVTTIQIEQITPVTR